MAVDTIQEALVYIANNDTTVAALIGTRFYPARLPQGVTLPAARYAFAPCDRPDRSLSSVFAGVVFASVQVDVYANTYTEAWAVARALCTAFEGFKDTVGTVAIDAIRVDRIDDMPFEPAVDDYRVTLDLTAIYREA